jgi:beta-galactosidase
VLDTCGFAKDGYYFYQSQWTAKPVLHVFPHWNWPGHEGQIFPVIAYSNCDTVELFLNGRSLGAKAHEFPRQGTAGGWNTYARPQILPTTADLHMSWDVPYEPGMLKAVGYRDGKQVAETEIRTAGPAAMITLSVDHDTLRAGSREVANVTVEVRDANGILVPTADNLISWEVQGEGTLVGVDSGDPLSHANFQGHTGKAFNGLALGIVQAGAKVGEVRVNVAADGLKTATVVLQVVESPDLPRPMIVGLDQ